MRLFDKPLGREVGSRFGKTQQICLTGIVTTGVTQQLDTIQSQLDLINQKLQSQSESSSTQPDYSFESTAPTKVGLYYFNQLVDKKLSPEQQINISSLLPVYRVFPPSKNLLVDTIHELIKWSLTSPERTQWFISEFPHPDFHLVTSTLSKEGILTLEFTEVPGFTSGWSARMLILSNSIQKTALQFPGVEKVLFVPETLFQP